MATKQYIDTQAKTFSNILEDELLHDEHDSEDNENETALQPILENYTYDESSFEGLSTTPLILEKNQTNEATTEESTVRKIKKEDPLLLEIKTVLQNHKVLEQDLILKEIISVIRKNTNFYEAPKDSILKEIDTSTSISYWKRECPALFDYPDKMHGYKTSWEFLKGVYNPEKHKQLYYNDLKEINHKLYRAVYRRNSKEKFLPSHTDRIAEEIKAMKENKIKLADIKNPKLKERFRMRFHSEK